MTSQRKAALRLGRARFIQAIACACAWCGVFSVQGDVVTQSRSGQFLVHAETAATPSLTRGLASAGGSFLVLEPEPVAVSCERIKQALLRELGMADHWHGQIHVRLRRRDEMTGRPFVGVVRFADRWDYEVNLPDEADRIGVVRAVVDALLMEIAQRSQGSYTPEIPIWLLEGMTGLLLTQAGPDLVVEPNSPTLKVGNNWAAMKPTSRSQLLAETNKSLRKRLQEHGARTFGDLSLPSPESLEGDRLDDYRANSQMLLGELLKLPGGRVAFQVFVGRLNQNLNWQTAFLQAFGTQFPRFVDVEKWWAMVVAEFTGEDIAHAWSLEKTLEHLGRLLRVNVEVRANAKAAPQRREWPMAVAIEQLDGARLEPAVHGRITQLQAMRLHAAPAAVPLVTEYAATLGRYLALRPRVPPTGQLSGPAELQARILLRDTLKRLEELDRFRASLVPMQVKAPTPRAPTDVAVPEK